MRVLVTGIGTFWGSRLAQELEARRDVEVVVGLGTHEPILPLERTEFVRADSGYTILQRIVHATEVDTILHTHLIADSTELSGRALHEINVIGTMNLLAAAGTAQSPVRKVVVKSSTLVYGSSYHDPYFFREDMPRSAGARTRIERSLLEVESFVSDFAEDNPHVTVTMLRFTNVLGDHMQTPFSTAMRLPVVPEILGFDPRLQFTHEDDVVGALVYATTTDVPGVYNVAGDGTLPWSEACRIVGKRRVPLPPVLTNLAVEPLRILRIVDLPPEMLALLRYGRGVDNTRYKQAGFRYRFTSAGTVEDFARGLRIESTVGERQPAYRYERDVETFFRHSPAVVRNRE
ncbi:MAG: NAD-dependent epimerase/dehydratase family protein [Acidimicrobiia bacterium]